MGNVASKNRDVVVNAGALKPSCSHKLRSSSRFLSYTENAASLPGGELELMQCVPGDTPISGGVPLTSGSISKPALHPGLDTRGFRRSHRALESKFHSSWINYKSSKFRVNFCFKIFLFLASFHCVVFITFITSFVELSGLEL